MNTVGIILSTALVFFVFLIFIGLHITGIRYAVDHKSLLDIPSTFTLLQEQPKLTRFLLLSGLLFGIVVVATTILGTVLMIIPGHSRSLFVSVLGGTV